jgi:curli biogenesis system outer membrane secretion channel CsgG
MRNPGLPGLLAICLSLGLALGAAARAPANAAEASPTPSGKTGEPADARVAVAIYDFRSSVTEIPARGATDMFIDALVQNGQFRVVERSQMNQSLLVERQLASQTPTAAQDNEPLRAARYLFEGTISEANASETQHSSAFGIAGMQIAHGNNTDVIAVDVRVVDAHNGDVLDTVVVRKPVKSQSASVTGIGNLLGTVLAQHGKNTTYTPNLDASEQRKESLDTTLRAIINEAVEKLAARFSSRDR